MVVVVALPNIIEYMLSLQCVCVCVCIVIVL